MISFGRTKSIRTLTFTLNLIVFGSIGSNGYELSSTAVCLYLPALTIFRTVLYCEYFLRVISLSKPSGGSHNWILYQQCSGQWRWIFAIQHHRSAIYQCPLFLKAKCTVEFAFSNHWTECERDWTRERSGDSVSVCRNDSDNQMKNVDFMPFEITDVNVYRCSLCMLSHTHTHTLI